MDTQDIITPLKKLLAQTQSFVRTTWTNFQNIEYTRNQWLLVFGLALVAGISCKAIAINTITIGYEDYKIASNNSQTLPPIKEESLTKGPLCEE